MMLKRTIYAGQLTETCIGEAVVLMGWVQNRRDLGGVIFLDLRDKTGICQVVLDASYLVKNNFEVAEKLRLEYVIAIKGIVELRSEETINPNLVTGTLEVRATEVHLFSESKTPPFEIASSQRVKEESRLKYRYLDLRNEVMHHNLQLRQKVTHTIRTQLMQASFLEVETPLLTKSTPEGARDFLVPSRMEAGKFYALPQSPQIYKQLLMVGGIDRYFQVARCFRDEDLRADRQPEFTQVDLEMSFIDQEDIVQVVEDIFCEVFQQTLNVKLPTPFRRMTYAEAMSKYGFDKPDLRFEMPMQDVTRWIKQSSFSIFNKVVESSGIVKAIVVKEGDALTRAQIEFLTDKAFEFGSKGLAWMGINLLGEIRSVMTKYFEEAVLNEMFDAIGAVPGDMIFFCADQKDKVQHILGHLRLAIGDLMGLRNKNDFSFVIVTEFPLFEYDEAAQRLTAMHHPFTAPLDEDVKRFDTSPGQMRAKAYDFVLNGIELGSGSIRIYQKDMQKKMFEMLGLSPDVIEQRFGFMLNSFEYGVPPHGGFAFGLDRLLMLMTGSQSIREVIAFPKMRDGSCVMMSTPSTVDLKQIEELGLLAPEWAVPVSSTSKKEIDRMEKLADLARLSLTVGEREALSNDLTEIIAFADQLASIEYDDAAFDTGLINVLRDDIQMPSLERESFLQSAPMRATEGYLVPKTVE